MELGRVVCRLRWSRMHLAAWKWNKMRRSRELKVAQGVRQVQTGSRGESRSRTRMDDETTLEQYSGGGKHRGCTSNSAAAQKAPGRRWAAEEGAMHGSSGSGHPPRRQSMLWLAGKIPRPAAAAATPLTPHAHTHTHNHVPRLLRLTQYCIAVTVAL